MTQPNATYRYVPILRAKAAEFTAIKKLDPSIRSKITPMLVVLPDDTGTQTVKGYLTRLAKYMASSLGNERAFIDWYDERDPGIQPDGRHAIEHLFSLVTKEGAGRGLIPVTGIDRSQVYIDSIKRIIKQQNTGLCIRLRPDDAANQLATRIQTFIGGLNLSANDVDLVIDLGPIQRGQVTSMVFVAQNILTSLPLAGQWRSVTLAGTSFPRNLGGITPFTPYYFPRLEWQVWTQVHGNSLPRRVDFGDYAVEHPEYVPFDPRRMTPSVNIRYTTDRDWLVLKARSERLHGREQFRALCRQLIQMTEYCGPTYSAGDQYIQLCARGKTGPGNPQKWREVAVSHHLTFVANQVSNLSAASMHPGRSAQAR